MWASRLFIVTFLLAAGLSSEALADVTACDLLSKVDIEKITGMKVGEPEVERLNICGGLCESNDGWRCMYRSIEADSSQFVWLDMYLPPFAWSDAHSVDETITGNDKLARTARFAVDGFSAFWYFRADQEHSFLHVDGGPKARFLIGQDGIAQYDTALDHAKTISELVLRRYRNWESASVKTPGKLKP